MSNKSVFIIDDEPDFLELIQEVLEEHFVVTAISTGQGALDKLREEQPDIILLDVGLPDIDGYQVCKEIKKIDPDDNISVIFVSGHDSLEERLTGYNVGADDYIVKPVDIEVLLAKVHAISKFQQGKESVKAQEQFSRDMAFQAMSEASQYGSVLQFVKKAASCTTIREIALEVIGICTEFSLNCSVQIREDSTLTIRSNGGGCSPIEHQLFDVLSTQGRVYTFNKRFMFNDRHISILITNMPIEDEARSGRLNDLLATVVEAAESAIISLARLNSLNKLLETTETALNSISLTYAGQKNETISIMDKMMMDMEVALSRLGLTLEQENFFIHLAESTQDTLIQQFVDAHVIESDLSNIVGEIRKRVGGSGMT